MPSTLAQPCGAKSAIRWLFTLLDRSSSDSVPTCSMPTSSYRKPCASTSRRTAVSAIDTTSSSSSHAAHSAIRSPTVYLPGTPCAVSSSAAETAWRGTYTSSACRPAWREVVSEGGCGLGRRAGAGAGGGEASFRRAAAAVSRRSLGGWRDWRWTSRFAAGKALGGLLSPSRSSASLLRLASCAASSAAGRQVSRSMCRTPTAECCTSQCANCSARSPAPSTRSLARPSSRARAELTAPSCRRHFASSAWSKWKAAARVHSLSPSKENAAPASTMR
mmetsp:Transcript_46780/g.151801  ORF Transcript_46780/g.151801 Transcript_46780/m.151801 type:complete len:276 (-) Transcript_46780:464-1291(-)